MGTHPIFESDFDCLTDLARCKIQHTQRPQLPSQRQRQNRQRQTRDATDSPSTPSRYPKEKSIQRENGQREESVREPSSRGTTCSIREMERDCGRRTTWDSLPSPKQCAELIS